MIVRWYPENGLGQVDLAWFESDAQDDIGAIKEIDAEAFKHGLARTREYWLPSVQLPDGRFVRRGICHRPVASGMAERMALRRTNEPFGISSAEIVRTLRDRE
ncbi:MAG: hypothetical protein M3Y56_06040 [Armatimonadota bacterium]|nr:hypothetical protein [Armatimonadota bacterium]